MPTHPSILVGLDFFESSIAALRESIRLHESLGGSLRAIHVIDRKIWDKTCEDFGLTYEAVTERANARLRYEVAEMAGHADGVETTITYGHPVDQLHKACASHDASLVVVGASGMKEHQDGSLGSVSSRLLRHAPADVLIVRKDHTDPFRRIVVAIDFSESSNNVLAKAISVAEANHAELNLVYVMPHLHQSPRYRGPLEALGFEEVRVKGLSESKLIEQAEKDLLAFVDSHRQLLKNTRLHSKVIADDDVAHGLLAHLESYQADLIVLGKHGHSNPNNLAIGSIPEKIASSTNCSIFAVG